ncbi:hypothetical protein IAT40_008023 [Kwoniella sp. CBS 6097]
MSDNCPSTQSFPSDSATAKDSQSRWYGLAVVLTCSIRCPESRDPGSKGDLDVRGPRSWTTDHQSEIWVESMDPLMAGDRSCVPTTTENWGHAMTDGQTEELLLSFEEQQSSTSSENPFRLGSVQCWKHARMFSSDVAGPCFPGDCQHATLPGQMPTAREAPKELVSAHHLMRSGRRRASYARGCGRRPGSFLVSPAIVKGLRHQVQTIHKHTDACNTGQTFKTTGSIAWLHRPSVWSRQAGGHVNSPHTAHTEPSSWIDPSLETLGTTSPCGPSPDRSEPSDQSKSPSVELSDEGSQGHGTHVDPRIRPESPDLGKTTQGTSWEGGYRYQRDKERRGSV